MHPTPIVRPHALRSTSLLLLSWLLAAGCGFDTEQLDPPMPATPLEDVSATTLIGSVSAARDMTPDGSWHSQGGALVRSGDELFAVDRDNETLFVLDETSLEVERTIPLGARPEQVAVGPDGTAWVTLRYTGAVARILPGGTTVTNTLDVGTEPYGIALAADGSAVLVTLSGDAALVALAPDLSEELDRRALGGVPRGLAVRQADVWVARQYGSTALTTFDTASGFTDAVDRDLREFNPWSQRPDPAHPTGALAVTVHPNSDTAFVAHSLVRPGEPQAPDEPAPPSDGYGGGANAELDRPVEGTVSVVPRIGDGEPGFTTHVPIGPDGLSPAASWLDQPVAIVHHPTRSILFVAGYGTDAVLALVTGDEDPMVRPMAVIGTGQAPRGLAISSDGQRLLVLSEHDHTVSSIDLAVADAYAGDSIVPFLGTDGGRQFATSPLSAPMQRGRRLFTFRDDPRVSGDRRFACGTCHFEGAEDKQVWEIGDGPRQTPQLAGRLADTAPYNWLGSEHDLAGNMRQTIERMGGLGFADSDLGHLETFLRDGLRRPPHPDAGRALTAEELRGQELFFDTTVGCSTCHAGAAYTNGANYDVGTATAREQTAGLTAFNTPSLRDVWRTAPYLHDGSAATLLDVLERTANTMGHTAELSLDDKKALVAFLETL